MFTCKDGPVHFHDSKDFDWEELRMRAEPMLRAQQQATAAAATATSRPTASDMPLVNEEAGNAIEPCKACISKNHQKKLARKAKKDEHKVARLTIGGEDTKREVGALPSTRVDTQGQIDGWERHFRRHVDAPTPFFKERRALLEEFPQLKKTGIRILEVGSGNGSNVLPVLKHNPSASVHATDPCETAVEDTKRRIWEAGLSDRLTTEIQPTPTMPCSAEYGPFDVVMILCTLSAIPGNDDSALLTAAASLLRPGGLVLIRDHGLYDMRHLRDMQRDAILIDPVRPAYLRPGGMHRRYYCLEDMQALAAAARLNVDDNRYLCIRQHNHKRGIHMDRVYVHAVLRTSTRDANQPYADTEETTPCTQPAASAHPPDTTHAARAGTCPSAAAYVNAIRSCGADGTAATRYSVYLLYYRVVQKYKY